MMFLLNTLRAVPMFMPLVGLGLCLGSLTAKPVKVFILAGQSNMQGHGRVEGVETKGTLAHLAENDEKYKHLKKGSGWAERDDVSISWLGRKGKLAPGFGVRDGSIGPELGFGHVMGDHFEEPVLLIKTAWGGKSLAVDFRPPSAGGDVGPFYTEMVTKVKGVLEDLNGEFPGLGKDYEIVGFGWHQGWNDGCSMPMCQEYEVNLKHFIRDVRKEFGVENLPFVVADSGFGGAKDGGRRQMIRDAQAAPGKDKEFEGHFRCVQTGEFHRPVEESPSKQGYHWNSNAETYYLIGQAMGEAMKEILKESGGGAAEVKEAEVREFRSADGSQTFKGQFLGYDPRGKVVSVRRENGKTMKFKLELLHADDQAFVTGQTESK